MRALKRNKQNMWYSKPTGREPIYQTDEEGNIVYIPDGEGNMIPVDTGEYKTSYTEPVHFMGYVGSQLEDAITRAWGSDNTNNFAVLVLSKGVKDDDSNIIELTSGSLVWRSSERPDVSMPETADYLVDGVMDEELNETSYYLRKRK